MEILTGADALPFNPSRGAPQKYPWDTWMRNGVTIRIIRGVDYYIDTVTMRQQVYQKAQKLGGKVTTKRVDGLVAGTGEGIDLCYHAPVEESDFEFDRS